MRETQIALENAADYRLEAVFSFAKPLCKAPKTRFAGTVLETPRRKVKRPHSLQNVP